MSWYYTKGNDRIGPLTLEQLVGAAQASVLQPDDMIWTDGMPCWLPADTVPNLFSTDQPHPLLRPTIPPAADPGQDRLTRMILPVGRSGWAIAAGYLGLFAVLVFPAPLALIAGLLAVREIRRDPNLHGMGRAVFGIVMGAVFSVLLAFVLLGC